MLIDQLLDELQNDTKKLNEVEELFKSHQYPNKSITWIKRFIEIDYQSYLSEYGIKIFDFMQTHMRNGTNLLQVSYNDLLLVLNSKSRHTIQNALNELIEKGFIAIKIKGKGRISSVYMVNPQISIKGNCNIDYLTCEFWKLTGTTYKAKFSIDHQSIIHQNFDKFAYGNKAYTMGYDKQETSNGTMYFNKLNPPKLSKSYIDFMTNMIDDMGDLPI